MEGNQASIPPTCPDCGGEVRTACPECGAPIRSLMGIGCRECGTPLREPVLFGVGIRRKAERGAAAALSVDGPAGSDHNEKQSP
jgi:predicted amidophosphoribosyltransferase